MSVKNVLIQFEKLLQDFEYFWIGVLCAVIFTVACLLFQEMSEKKPSYNYKLVTEDKIHPDRRVEFTDLFEIKQN